MNAPLTQEEITALNTRKKNALTSLLKTYFPFFLALAFAYRLAHKKSIDRTISASDYNLIFLCVAIFLGGIFLFFVIRDFKRRVSPVLKAIKGNEKSIQEFVVRKYYDVIFKKHLLFHPDKPDNFILISESLYNQLVDGEYAELLSVNNKEIIFGLRYNQTVHTNVEEFNYKRS